MFDELKRRNVLRVVIAYAAAAWLIVQVVETLFPVFGLSDEAIRLVVIVLVIGFPLAIVFSWFYEITLGGIIREQDADHESKASRSRVSRFDRIIVAVLVLAIAYFAIDKFVFDPARDAELRQQIAEQARESALTEIRTGNRIAVLPFANRSGNPDDEYFSDGFSDDLIHRLSLDDRLEVISSRSSFSFKNTDATIPEIAEQLGASYIVDGTVRKSGENMRITVQLIDTVSDTAFWSDEFRPSSSELYDTQDRVSASIVDSLKIRLSLSSRMMTFSAATENTEAHDAYLRGRYLVAKRLPDLVPTALEQFETAVELDPNFALAHAEFAIALQMQGCTSTSMTDEDCEAASLMHAERAMALDQNLPEAHLAMTYHVVQREEAVPYLRKAIELNPNYSDAYARLADVYLMLPFRLQDRIGALQQALTYDPLSRDANWDYVYSLLERGLIEEARQQIEKFAVIDPEGARVMDGYVAALGGNTADYILAYLDASKGGRDTVIFGRSLSFDLNWQLIAIGLPDEALARTNYQNPEIVAWFSSAERGAEMVLARLEESPMEAPFETGLVLAHAGMYEEAKPYLEHIWQQMSPPARNDFYTAYVLEALVTIRRDAGDEELAQAMIAAADGAVRRFREAGINTTHQLYYSTDYLEGVVRYLQGNLGDSLNLFSKAVDDGFDIPPPSPFQQARYQDPGFAELLDRQSARHARERAKVLAVVCEDGYSHPTWSPLPETCARYR